MVAASVRTIEEVHVVYPDLGVLGVERDAVVHAAHDGKIAELHTRSVAAEESKAVYCGIVAHALECEVHLAVFSLALDLKTLFRT